MKVIRASSLRTWWIVGHSTASRIRKAAPEETCFIVNDTGNKIRILALNHGAVLREEGKFLMVYIMPKREEGNEILYAD